MKNFDSKGEYTPSEVKAALAGIDGTRQLSFRYERLDRDNNFVEDIDYVQSCSIENNSLADIKRVAKMSLLDSGKINYLQDRIKPYARIAMPPDPNYDNTVRSMGPDVWWKFDDPKPPTSTLTGVSIADALNYNTRETAYVAPMPTDLNTISAWIQAGSGTLRSEFWVQFEVADSKALEISLAHWANIPGLRFEMYTSPAVDGPLTMFFPNNHDSPIGDSNYNTSRSFSYAFPTRGFYYIRAYTTNASVKKNFTIDVNRAYRIDDSSVNNVAATGSNLNLRATPVIGSGYSLKTSYDGGAGDYSNGWLADQLDMTHGGAIVTNMWANVDSTNGYVNSRLSIGTDQNVSWDSAISLWAEGGSMDFTLEAGWFYGEISVPSDRYEKAPLLITTVYAPDKDKASLYLNSEYIGEFIDSSGSTPLSEISDFHDAHIYYLEGGVSVDGVMYIDDTSIFYRELSVEEIKSIYLNGIGASSTAARSGYVEWPLGVFVLSSPSRRMVDGNTVVRDVDGYDQLVILKEDTFDYRYSVKAGRKYTEAIRTVLFSSFPRVSVPFTLDLWTPDREATILSPDSISLTAIANNTYPGVQTDSGVLTMGSFDLSARMTGASDGYVIMYIRTVVGDFGFKLVGGNLSAINLFQPMFTVAYSATSHKFWRIRESEGFLLYETSADGVIWDSFYSIVNPMNLSDTVTVIFETQKLASSTVKFDNMKLSAPKSQKMNIVNSNSTLPASLEWEPGTPKLKIINDLLGAINYGSAVYDENGIFSAKPYVAPSVRSSEFTYATDSASVITGNVDQTIDLFGVPNKWIIVVSEPDRPVLVGSYTNSSPHSPTSTVSRGRTIVDFRTEQSAPDQVTLDAQAARLAFEASQVYEVIEFDTATMPIHSDSDVYDLIIDGLVVNSKYSEQSWSMTLENGAAMSHRVRKVVSI